MLSSKSSKQERIDKRLARAFFRMISLGILAGLLHASDWVQSTAASGRIQG